ncbi:MAG: GlsB/YeaQ/YmgE family stress response membrane protein [Candidatus Sericytochromatia bacterium]
MSIISMIIIGLIIGIIAKLLMPGRDPGGFILTSVLGIAGSFVAGFLGQALGLYRSGEPAGFIASIIGSMVLLGVYRLVSGRSTTAI